MAFFLSTSEHLRRRSSKLRAKTNGTSNDGSNDDGSNDDGDTGNRRSNDGDGTGNNHSDDGSTDDDNSRTRPRLGPRRRLQLRQ